MDRAIGDRGGERLAPGAAPRAGAGRRQRREGQGAQGGGGDEAEVRVAQFSVDGAEKCGDERPRGALSPPGLAPLVTAQTQACSPPAKHSISIVRASSIRWTAASVAGSG